MYGIGSYGLGSYGAPDDSVATGAKPLGPAYYGAVAFGDIGEYLGSYGSGVETVYASSAIVLTAELAATSLHGTTATFAYSFTPVVDIGADPTNRECVANLQLPLVTTVVATSQPVTSTANIAAPLAFSATSAVKITGTAALTVQTPTVSITSRGANAATVAITAPLTANFVSVVAPAARAPIVVSPTVTITAQQRVFAYGGIRPSVGFSATGLAGRSITGAVKAPFAFSGTVRVGPFASGAAMVRPTVSATSVHGTKITGAAQIIPSVAATSIFYRRIDGTVAFYPPLEFRSKAKFGAVLDEPDLVFTRTKNQPIYART